MAVIMNIQEVTMRLKREMGLSQKKIAKLLSVEPLTVSLYQRGKIKHPRPELAFKVYETIKLNGEKVVLDIFSSEEELISAMAFHKEAEAIEDEENKDDAV